MGKKNWIEFDNQEKQFEETAKKGTFKKISNINISKQKKGKKKMRQIGKVEVPQEAFLSILKVSK